LSALRPVDCCGWDDLEKSCQWFRWWETSTNMLLFSKINNKRAKK
jgi:hypothetical protein